MKRLALICVCAVTLSFGVGAATSFASETQGTISDTSKYGWGENIGWINFAPAQGELYRGLSITDSAVTGYAWSSNFGWVNFSPTNSGQGVTNTSGGVLGGSAWIQNVGWLSMSGVTIDSHGVFRGIAGVASTTVGRVSFECDKCAIATDWRPLSARTSNDVVPPSPAGGNGPVVVSQRIALSQAQPIQKNTDQVPSISSAGASEPNVSIIPVQESSPVHFQTQSGEYHTTVDVPSGASDGSLRISVQQKPSQNSSGTAADTSPSLRIVGSTYFDITAISSNGQEVHSFKKPIKITLKLPKGLLGLDASGLEVCWYDTVHGVWIPVPSAVFSDSTVSFFVDHLTRFAILRILPPSATSTPSAPPLLPSQHSMSNVTLVILCIVVAVLVWFFWRRRKEGAE